MCRMVWSRLSATASSQSKAEGVCYDCHGNCAAGHDVSADSCCNMSGKRPQRCERHMTAHTPDTHRGLISWVIAPENAYVAALNVLVTTFSSSF